MPPENVVLEKKALEDALAQAVQKGTEANSVEVKSLVDQIATLETQIKALAEKSAMKVGGEEDEKSLHKKGMEMAGKMFRALAQGDVVEAKGLSEGTAADGGYLVHSEFIAGVFRAIDSYGLARKYATKYSMNSKDLEVTTLATNVTAYWVDEGAAITASNPTFGRVTITAKKLASIIEWTQELEEDADHNVAQTVAQLVAEQFAKAEDTVALTGTGTPFTGILGATGPNVVTMGSGDTSFEDISSDDLISLIRSVKVKYKSAYAPRFYMHQDVLAIVEKLKDSTGQPLYRSLNEAGKGVLLGYPVELTDVMPSISDDAVSTKFITFGDLKFLGMGDRKNVTAEVGYLTDGFAKDKKSLKVTERVGFSVLIGEAFGVLKTAAA